MIGSDTVLLTWSAPGDDGNTGKAAAYDARHSTSPITSENFSQADTLGGLPAPEIKGTQQNVYATNLPGSSTQYFAIRAADESGNWSSLSAIGPAHTLPDTIPPGNIVDLRIFAQTDSTATLVWTAPGDDYTRGRVSRYESRFLGGVLDDTSWDHAHAISIERMQIAGPGAEQSCVVSKLTARIQVELAIRAFDEIGNHSSASNAIHATLKGGTKTWIVRSDGSGTAPTIQSALDSAMSADTVLVLSGLYHDAISFNGKDLVLVSMDGPLNTTIDASGLQSPAVRFTSGETSAAIIRGFTITGGAGDRTSLGHGGGIYCQSASPTIDSNIIRGNSAIPNGVGGGIFCWRGPSRTLASSPQIVSNIISDNFAEVDGGGIGAWGRSPAHFRQYYSDLTARPDVEMVEAFGLTFRRRY